jgi:hypothetical protein
MYAIGGVKSTVKKERVTKASSSSYSYKIYSLPPKRDIATNIYERNE